MRHPALVVAATALLSTILHLTLGWPWTILAGGAAGGWQPTHGWLWGASGVSLGWAGLVVYSVGTAPGATRTLLDLVGTLGGNIPGGLLIGATVLSGAVLGALGGEIGALTVSRTKAQAH